MLKTNRPGLPGRRWAALIVFALSTSPLGAQVLDGGTVGVSTYPWQIALYGLRPISAVDRRGNAVYVWSAYGPDGSPDGNGPAVVGRRFDRFGDALGPAFLINSYTTGAQERPRVAFDGQGRFVVTWAGCCASAGVFGQRFDSSGAPIGAEFTVTQSPWNFLAAHSLAVAPSGAFIVAWDGMDGNGSGIMARRFDPNGAPLGSEFQVNTYTTAMQQKPAIAFADDESFVVVYEGVDGSSSGIVGQSFSAAGDKVGAEFVANASTFASQVTPVVASVGNGGFVVIWSGDTPFNPERVGVVGRLVAATGEPLSDEFPISVSTAAYQVGPSVAASENGEFVVSYSSNTCICAACGGCGGPVFARRMGPSGAPRAGEFQVAANHLHWNYPSSVAADPYGNFMVSWSHTSVFARWYGGLLPETVEVDTVPTESSDGNGILEPGEMVSVVPSWTNANTLSQSFWGIAREFTGPAGPTYRLLDASATYGTVAYGVTESCASADDCYSVFVSEPSKRPALHWDAVLHEGIIREVQGQSRLWSLHVGASFSDVPRGTPFYTFVETLVHAGVTAGCTASAYCPGSSVTREQMAVFALVAKEGPGYLPPACGTALFADVPATSPFCPYVEELARRAVVSGCGPSLFCPTAPVTRDQMAVIVLRTADPAIAPPPCTPQSEAFADVPASSPFCPWIEELARRGVVTGCGGRNHCPAAAVTREQMAVFVTVAFGLSLYGT